MTDKAISPLRRRVLVELTKLKLSPVNVRKHGAKDVSDVIATIRSLGLIRPLLVRPNCEGFEVVAGQRPPLDSAERPR